MDEDVLLLRDGRREKTSVNTRTEALAGAVARYRTFVSNNRGLSLIIRSQRFFWLF